VFCVGGFVFAFAVVLAVVKDYFATLAFGKYLPCEKLCEFFGGNGAEGR